MSTNSQEFFNLSGSTESGLGKKPKGCLMTPSKWVGVFLGAAALAAIVGLIVYYEHPDKGKKCDETIAPTSSPDGDATTTVADDTIMPDIKLPDDLVPIHYDLRLRANFYNLPEEDFEFNGSVRIEFRVAEGKTPNQIILHQKKLTIDEDSISLSKCDEDACPSASAGSVIDGWRIEEDAAPLEFYRVVLPTGEQLESEKTYSLEISFRGPLKGDLAGWYFSEYTDAGVEKYLVTTQMQATDARKVFPCFDEPALKATFTTTIERPDALNSWANMPVVNEEVLDGGWVADHYEKSPAMSTYLLAFVVSDFVCRNTSTKSGTLVQICARPNAIDQTGLALNISADILEFYEEYHNVSYPLTKAAHMAVPDFAAGAMENWGLILYRETALLYEEGVTSSFYKQRVAVVVAHELAHMWFGNLVTPAWWDDIWLNEGFASYMEYLGVDYVFGDTPVGFYDDNWQMEDQTLSDDIHRVFPIDSLTSSHPVYTKVESIEQISALFDTITYSKGASVIRMMNYFLGEEVFRLGISDYLKEYAYAASNHTQLFQFLTEKSEMLGSDPVNVGEVMNTWILQLGYPVVHYSYDKDQEELTVSQQQYLLDPSQESNLPPSEYDYIWRVPISMVMVDECGTCDEWEAPKTYWLLSKEDTIEVEATSPGLPAAEWYIGNVNERFYYRVNYDDDNWAALIGQLKLDHTKIHRRNRAQILDDLFSLGRAGWVNQTLALDASMYMQMEHEYVPWTAINRNIGYIKQMLAFTRSYGYLQEFMQDIVEEPHDYFTWDTEGDKHLRRRTRVYVMAIACSFDFDYCVNNATTQYQNWMNDPDNNAIDPDLRLTTYCTAIRSGGWDEWEHAFQQFGVSNSGSEKITLLRGMACSQEMWILNGYLERAINLDGIKRQDFSSILQSVAANHNGRALAWNFFRANWDKIFEWFSTSSFTLASLVTGVTENFSTEFELSELEAFISATPEQGSGARAFQQAIDRTKANIVWRASNEADVTAWLKLQAEKI